MRFDILSLFPEYFQGPFSVSIIKRAIEKRLIEIGQVDIRDFAEGKHRKVDDKPYGGGPGMVMMPAPVVRAIRHVKREKSHVIHLSAQAPLLTAKRCRELSAYEHLILVCGHYEGIDERAIEKEVDEQISVGSFVLTNGCLAAVALIDATTRFIPGVLGCDESASDDSFEGGILAAPQYTMPEVFEGSAIPAVLKSGNHKEIMKWRAKAAIEKTLEMRPDLISKEQ